MEIYKFTPEGNAKMKKQWLFTVFAFYIPSAGIFAFNLLYRGGTTQDIIIFSVIFVAMCVAYYFGHKKHLLTVDSTRLIVHEDKVTYHVSNQPDITIEYTSIRKVTPRKHGIFLVNRYASKKSLFIPNTFENYDAIEKLITQKVGNYDMAAVAV